MSTAPTTYESTRGGERGVAFEDVVLAGMAHDGGLYVPEQWPRLTTGDYREWSALDYPELASKIAQRFDGSAFTPDEWGDITRSAYAAFRHPDVAPLRQLDDGLHLLELFWGPTLSFKDYALQLLGEVFDRLLARRSERVTVVVATSGDTGSAAIAALAGRDAVDVVVLHPHGRVSEVQRRQMTTVDEANVHNIAIEGTFDDCQAIVKAMFADEVLRSDLRLGAVNSINFGRIVAQITYYAWAALRLGAGEAGVGFAVPTGNFGNVYAGYAARNLGIPINRLVAANNRNHTLNGFLRTGTLRPEEVVPTIAPAMDIQVPSNLERLLFDLFDRDGAAVASAMSGLRANGVLTVPTARLGDAKVVFDSMWMADDAIEGYIGQVASQFGVVVDPHTAIGIAATQTRPLPPGTPYVAVATAHPAKFPDAVERATGTRPSLPPELEDLYERPERFELLPAQAGAVAAAARRHVER